MTKHMVSLFILLSVSLSSFSFDVKNNVEETKRLFNNSTLKSSYVMVGDSITKYGAWQDLLSNTDIANRGVGGDTSALILKRMKSILLLRPKRSFLMFGINDFALKYGVDEVFNNYKNIISILHKASINVVISSTIQCNIYKTCKGKEFINENVKLLNLKLKKFCEDNGIIFINIDEKLSKSDGLQDKYSTDGTHLNLNGYKEWAKLLSPLIY